MGCCSVPCTGSSSAAVLTPQRCDAALTGGDLLSRCHSTPSQTVVVHGQLFLRNLLLVVSRIFHKGKCPVTTNSKVLRNDCPCTTMGLKQKIPNAAEDNPFNVCCWLSKLLLCHFVRTPAATGSPDGLVCRVTLCLHLYSCTPPAQHTCLQLNDLVLQCCSFCMGFPLSGACLPMGIL